MDIVTSDNVPGLPKICTETNGDKNAFRSNIIRDSMIIRPIQVLSLSPDTHPYIGGWKARPIIRQLAFFSPPLTKEAIIVIAPPILHHNAAHIPVKHCCEWHISGKIIFQ